MIRIFGIAERLDPIKQRLSDVINEAMIEAIEFPPDKRAHRFFPMSREDFVFPSGRTEAYTVIEICLMQGRSEPAKKRLIKSLFRRIRDDLGLDPIDVEVMLFEAPPCNFGFRGMTGDEARLDYRIDI